MELIEFEQKYNKNLAKIVANLYYDERLDEFLSDAHLFSLYLGKKRSKNTLIFPDVKSAIKFLDYVSGYNIIVLDGYVSSVENRKGHDVINKIERYIEDGDVLVCVFDASPEADVTYDLIKEKFTNVQVYRMPFGISALSPGKTDEYTFNKVLKSILFKD